MLDWEVVSCAHDPPGSSEGINLHDDAKHDGAKQRQFKWFPRTQGVVHFVDDAFGGLLVMITPSVTFGCDATGYKVLLKKVSSPLSATEYLTARIGRRSC